MEKLSPMLAQYQAVKKENPDVILLFRLGDFYEMFGDDARAGAKALDLTLTSREIGKGRRLPMCGVPHHALQRYVGRLLAAGHKVAVCDQVEDPKTAKGLVKREVTRILTPGTIVEDYLLDERRNNYLVSVTAGEEGFGLAAVDVSTGDFQVTELHGTESVSRLQDELGRLQPAEVVLPAAAESALGEAIRAACAARLTTQDAMTEVETSYQSLTRHFGTTSLRGFGCEELPLAVEAAAAALRYLRETHRSALEQIRGLSTYSLADFMILDGPTRRNLELTISLRDGTRANTLLWLLDETVNSMGARMLRRWLLAPLLDAARIGERLDAVQALREDDVLRARLREALRGLHDLERLVSRSAAGVAHGRDLSGLRDSLAGLPALRQLLSESAHPTLRERVRDFDVLEDLADLLAKALADEPSVSLREGGLIRPGYSAELDELREIRARGKEWIASLESTERARTGIKSLRVGFNQVFGYYLEVSRSNLSRAPADYIRKQTLANAERFITPSLKEYEARVLGAEEKVADLEYRLFVALREQVAREAERLQATARRLAALDALAGLAELAAARGYVRPAIEDGDALRIADGRHPVVEATQREERFVPNDTELDCSDKQILIITGPNMAGKSTYLRQVALIALMAQMGSFVPAREASIGLVDRIFTRVGASDDLATGQSTFMVEMNETANILHNATRRSLVILDEIGRGTSTFDGLSIAWAVVEYLHSNRRMGAKTLFATHYHHLNELAESLPRVKNYRIAVKEEGDRIIFLRRIVPGGTDRSYGIQVARLAGLPQEVIERAKQVLWSLEQRNNVGQLPVRADAPPPPAAVEQLALFAPPEPAMLTELRGLNIEAMTPLEALNKLAELQRKLGPFPRANSHSGGTDAGCEDNPRD